MKPTSGSQLELDGVAGLSATLASTSAVGRSRPIDSPSALSSHRDGGTRDVVSRRQSEIAPSARTGVDGFAQGEPSTANTEAKPTDMHVRSNPPVLMSEREVAVFIGICPRSVRNFTSRGLLPVIRLGRRRLYRRDAVLAALSAMERHAGG